MSEELKGRLVEGIKNLEDRDYLSQQWREVSSFRNFNDNIPVHSAHMSEDQFNFYFNDPAVSYDEIKNININQLVELFGEVYDEKFSGEDKKKKA